MLTRLQTPRLNQADPRLDELVFGIHCDNRHRYADGVVTTDPITGRTINGAGTFFRRAACSGAVSQDNLMATLAVHRRISVALPESRQDGHSRLVAQL